MQKYNSDDTLSDSSVKLPKCTGDYDKDIPPSPKVTKCKPGQCIKKSVSGGTSTNTKPVPREEGNASDNSDMFVPCSGTVSSKNTIYITYTCTYLENSINFLYLILICHFKLIHIHFFQSVPNQVHNLRIHQLFQRI